MNTRRLTLSFIILLSTLAGTPSTFASELKDTSNFADTGPYITGQLGGSNPYDWSLDSLFSPLRIRTQNNLAGRIGLGYQLNKHVGIEVGMSAFPDLDRVYNSDWGLFRSQPPIIAHSKIRDIYMGDLTAVLRIPIGSRFYIAGTAGLAITHFTYEAMNLSFHILNWKPGSATFLEPNIGLRTGFKLNDKVSVFASAAWSLRTSHRDIYQRDFQPALTMYTIGVSYHLDSII